MILQLDELKDHRQKAIESLEELAHWGDS